MSDDTSWEVAYSKHDEQGRVLKAGVARGYREQQAKDEAEALRRRGYRAQAYAVDTLPGL